MTLPAAGNPLSMDDIDGEYGLGTDLSAYRGVRWYLENASTGTFDSTNIDIAEFYSTRATSPVTPDDQTFTSSGTFTVPTYSVLTVTIKGGSGGGAGGSGNVAAGSPGTSGTASSFGSYGTGDFGRGGTLSAVGESGAGSDGTPAGGAGGGGTAASGYRGGHGGKTVITLTNPAISGTGPAIGATVTVTVGSGGTGGAGGTGLTFVPGVGYVPTPSSPGSNGTAGSVLVEWA